MGYEIILKLAGVGLVTAIVNQLLRYCGKEEISNVTTLAGLIVALMMVLNLIQSLVENVKDLFNVF